MKKNILIIGSGPNQLPAIRMAKSRGYQVLATDMDPEAEGFPLADATGIVSTRDVKATVDFARKLHARNPINGVMSMASESAVTVAMVAKELGLPGLSPVAAQNATNKIQRQQLFQKKGVPAPGFAYAKTIDDACDKAKELGWPVVVKPADSAGSRGVQKVETPEDMRRAISEIRIFSNSREVLLEEFLSGTEHSIEGIVVTGEVYWAGLSDRNYDKKEAFLPYFLEDGDTMPTALDTQTVQAVQQAATQAVYALGIDSGPVKGDILIDPKKGINVLEMAARLSGDYFCSETIPLHNGINLVEAVMDLSLGLPISPEKLKPRFNKGVALRYVWPEPGRVTNIQGLEAARALPGVHFVRLEPKWKSLQPGTIIPKPTSMGERVVSVMTCADTKEEAVSIAEKAVRLIHIVTKSDQMLIQQC